MSFFKTARYTSTTLLIAVYTDAKTISAGTMLNIYVHSSKQYHIIRLRLSPDPLTELFPLKKYGILAFYAFV